MMGSTRRIAAVLLLVIAGVILSLFLYRRRSEVGRISRFGEYRGYSKATYDGYERHSDYLALSDGTKLAYDVLIPTRKGIPSDEPLPVLFSHTTYLRAFMVFDRDEGRVIETEVMDLGWIAKAFIRVRALLREDGHIFDVASNSDWLSRMIKHGYVVVVVERRGTGASTGVINPAFESSAREADEILEWIAAQPWCDGHIGMFGESFVAMTQFAAASANSPHLKAIFPTSSSFDMYDDLIYPGGVYNKGFVGMMARGTAALEKMVVPVDSDQDGGLLAQILEERHGRTVGEAGSRAFELAPYRDSDSSHPEGDKLWEDMGLYNLVDRINQSGVAVYGAAGWYDIFTRGAFLWHANLATPRRLLIGPWFHEEVGVKKGDLDLGAEKHRWFDYWLKGIDNGVMDGPAVHYTLMGAGKQEAWHTAEEWPLPDQQITRYYLAEGRTGSVDSLNDGFLGTQAPDGAQGFDACVVDYTTTTGPKSRWASVIDVGAYPELRANDEKALTYTTPPLADDVEVTGHPVVHVWLTTDAADLDVFVYLEAVDIKGHVAYITEGSLRASHRMLSEAPFDNLGLPYQRSAERDLEPIPAGEPVELVFDLLPTSTLFRKGSRIRVTVAFTDADNFETPVLDPAPNIRLLRDAGHAAFVELPVISGD